MREFQELSFQVSKDQHNYRLTTDSLLRDVDLSFRVAHARTSETGVLIGFKGAWASVVNEKTAQRSWWAVTEIQPVPDDLGLAVPLTTVSLRKTPDWKGELAESIAPLERLKILQFQDHWVEVSPLADTNITGWLDLGSLVLKHDFATFALPKNGKWTPIRYRQEQYFVTGSGDKIEIKDVKAMMTRADLALLSENLDSIGLHMRSYLTINSWEYITWAVSKLPGHGEVYWKSTSTESHKNLAAKEDLLSFDELLKRPIFSVSFDAKNPREGLISAEGIFLTEDGLTWRHLRQFHNDNLPVAMSADGELFVGSSRSTDGGKSFLPYLKWEQVTSMIEGHNKKSPRITRLVRIQPLGKHKVEIEIDNGIKTTRLEGSTQYGLVTNWRLK